MGEMENEKEVNITYETLFEMLRIEKDKEELQKLSSTFFNDVIAYLREKETAISNATLTSPEDKKKLDNELVNIKKILKDHYERREKKILNLVLDISRTKSNLIDTSALLIDERELFDVLVKTLDQGREAILHKLLESRMPYFKPASTETKDEPAANESSNEPVSNEPSNEHPKEQNQVSQQPDIPAAETKIPEPDAVKNESESNESEASKNDDAPQEVNNEAKEEKPTKMVRFMGAVPKFVGKELEEYGPFDEEDVANLPTAIAKVLIEKGRAEEIEEQ